MTLLTGEIIEEIRAHAAQEFPKEACGVVIVRKGKQLYVPCTNLAASPSEHFILSPEDYAKAEDEGEIIRIVHSHPNTAPEPSEADRVGCENSGIPWLIVNWPTAKIFEFTPSGFEAPLIGRSFHHGILD